MIQILHNIQTVQEGKRHQKKRHQIVKLPNLCGNQHISTQLLLSLFLLFLREGVSNSCILNDIGRNSCWELERK
jgi:hypothetical protein